MDDYKHLCPVCKTNGKTSFLQLRQINFTTATYLCKDIRCAYPQAQSWIFVDRDTFNGDESDSDSSNISDDVNADIERMLMTTQNSNGFNVGKYLNNDYTSDNVNINFNFKAETDIYDRDKHKEYSTSHQSRITEKACDVTKTTKNSKGINVSKYLNNSYISEKINIDFNVNTETDIYDRDRHSLACEKYSTSEQLAITEDTCDDVIILDSISKIDNVIIEVPDELFTNIDLPSTVNTTNLQSKILASGAPNSDVADIAASKDIKPVTTDIQYHLVKDDKEPNKFNIDIGMIALQNDIIKGADNADVQYDFVRSNKEPNKSEIHIEILEENEDDGDELNNSKPISTETNVQCSSAKSVEESNKLKVDQKKNNNSTNSRNKKKGKARRRNLKSGKLSKLKRKQDTGKNLVNAENVNNVNVIKKPFDVSKVINVSKNINLEQNIISKSNEISSSEEKNEEMTLIKPTNIDFENIPNEDKSKDKAVKPDYKTNNSKEKKGIKVTARSKKKNNSLDLILPFVDDVDPELELKKPKQKLETVFQSKLKLQSKKSKQSSFCFSESIVQEAIKTANDSKDTEPPKNRSLISMLFDPNNSDVNNKNSASAFKGFKFSSEVIKPANPELPKENSVKESPSKCLVETFEMPHKEKKFNKKLRDKNREQVRSKSETGTVNNNSNTSASSKIESKDNTNLGLGDLTLNELFDNIDDLGTVNVPNNSIDIAEVDKWLTSLCE